MKLNLFEIDESLKKYVDEIDVLLYLENDGDFVRIKALKEHGNGASDTGSSFDAKTMLLSEK